MPWRRVNIGLVVAIVLVNGVTLLAPLGPQATFWWRQRVEHQPAKLTALIEATKPPASPSASTPQIPDGQRLIIPSIGLDKTVYEGPTAEVMRQGPWHRPASHAPDQGGNTVIAAHRFGYSSREGPFYSLDKLKPGDTIAVFWANQRYVYTVASIQTVTPDSIDVEAPTTDDRLTLYTCTPLWLPKNRLVVIAQRVFDE